jgi:hypothetical protein
MAVEKKNTLQQCVTTKPGRKKLQTSTYEKTESVLLELFQQKKALYLSVKGSMLRQKAEERVLELNTAVTPC